MTRIPIRQDNGARKEAYRQLGYFKTSTNAEQFDKGIYGHSEINPYPSLTIPDQAMTIPELLRRHTQGMPLTGSKVPFYDGEDPQPDLEHMDLSEVQAFVRKARTTIEEYKAAEQQKEIDQRRKDAEQIRDLRKQIEDHQKNSTNIT